MAHDPRAFFTLAQMAIRTTQKELGEMLGISRRTAQRYSEHGVPHEYKLSLARLVHPHSRELAAEIAQHAGATLVSLGLEAPPAPPPPPAPVAARPPPPPPPPPPPADGVVDAIVCAAAEAKDAKPGEVRTMLLAAFSRAREIGIDTAFVERVLRVQLALPPAPIPSPPVIVEVDVEYSRSRPNPAELVASTDEVHPRRGISAPACSTLPADERGRRRPRPKPGRDPGA